mgnify:CR=1 FL=1|tara:strand:- start:490 stop:630 length:141 start_codon:yes stop_codon:yes gene_type:complete
MFGLKNLKVRIKSFEIRADSSFRSKVNKSRISYDLIMIAIKELEEY